jgi:hypothetical protein
MADERDPVTEDAHGEGPAPLPRAEGQGDEPTQRMPVDDPTSTFDPFADDDDDDTDDEVTRALPADGEATRALPADGEATRALPADGEATRQVTPQIWAARVPVPVEDAPLRDPSPAQWREESEPQERGGSLVRPAVITLIVLILLAMLGTGLWLIFKGSGRSSAPTPGTSATPSGIPAPTETGTDTDTPTAASTTVTGQVAVPDVVGQTEAAAGQLLTAKGLTYTVVRRSVAGADPGTVTAAQPGAGTMVGPGTRVTLIVAAAPTPAPTTPGPTTPGPTRSAQATPSRVPTSQPPANQ